MRELTGPVDSPVFVQLVDGMLAQAISESASALRMTVQPDGSPVDFLIDGEWSYRHRVPKHISIVVVRRFMVLAGVEYWKKDARRTSECTVTVRNVPYSLHIAFFDGANGAEVLVEIGGIAAHE